MKLKRLNRLMRFWLRATIALRIVFRKKSVVVIYVTHGDLVHLVKSEPESIKSLNWAFAGLMEHQAKQVIIRMGDMIDPTEIICDKASFENSIIEKIKDERDDKNN